MMISVSTAIDIPIKVDSPHNAIWSMPPINTVVIPLKKLTFYSMWNYRDISDAQAAN